MLHALWRSYEAPSRPSLGVAEPEIDMRRREPQAAAHKPRLWNWFGKSAVIEKPRRSIDRALQEDWPTEYY